LELVIAGFAVVALPLIVALVTGAFYVDKLTTQSQQALQRAVQAGQTSRMLAEQLSNMERNIRQFYVLHDQQLFKSYLDRRNKYLDDARMLSTILVNEDMRSRLGVLVEMEAGLFSRLNLSDNEPGPTVVDPAEFVALTALAQGLVYDNSGLVDSEIAILQTISERAQTIIYWELAAVLPAAIIFIGLFVVLLSRPIRQIDGAIRSLGAGEFDQEIRVVGPQDLAYLGERLDWLRLRLKYLEEKRSKFLQYVSHELKTPLTAIRESAELVGEEVVGPLNVEQRDVVDILRRNTVNLQRMIEKLLSFNMPSTNPESAKAAEVQFSHLLQTVVADHKPAIISKRIVLEVDCENVLLRGDEEQLRAVVDNLLSNAVKYTPEGGTVRLKARSTDGALWLDVCDSGPGIEPAEKDKVFDAFYRGESVSNGPIHGSGLGLAIAREFVEAHQGRLELVSVPGQKGAHFRVTLPLVAVEKDLAWAV